MASLDEISDIDIFFYYGTLDEQLEMEHNLMVGLLQPEKSFYYNRSDSVGVDSYENHPNNLLLQINLRLAIANWVNYFNTYTGDGTGDSRERRIAISQFSIIFEQYLDKLNAEIFFIPFADYSQMKSVKVGIGGQ